VYHLYTPVKSSDRNISRELAEIRGNLGTSFSRIFAVNSLGLSRLKHVVEPELSYLFVPATNQSQIPIMDDIDRVNRRNVLTFGISNRLWGKFANPLVGSEADKDAELLNPTIADVRDFASLRLALSYDIDRERKGGDSLSDLDMNLRLRPTNYFTISLDGGVNPGVWQVTQTRAVFAISDPRPILRRVLDPDFNRPNFFSFGYYFLQQGPNGFLADNANFNVDTEPVCPNPSDVRCAKFKKDVVGNIAGNLLYHLTDHILIALNSTYSARDTRFVGVNAATKILSTCECWALTFGVRQGINPAKTSFRFDFKLFLESAIIPSLSSWPGPFTTDKSLKSPGGMNSSGLTPTAMWGRCSISSGVNP
jgi:hypothetical protein